MDKLIYKFIKEKKMKKRFFKATTAIVMLSTFMTLNTFTAFAEETRPEDKYSLSIIYNNDIHGHVEQLPQFKTIIDEARQECDNLLVLNGGDIFLRGEYQEYRGIPEMDLLNAIGYDAWVPGNNDFRVPSNGGTPEEGNQQIQALIDRAAFPTLCANVYMKDTGKYMDNVMPFTIKEVGGLNIGIIGVTSLKPQNRKWNEVSDKVFESGEITVANIMDSVDPFTDINIVLSHTGLAVDTKIANIKGVSAVIGADDHYIITNPIYYPGADNFKSSPIVQAGGEHDQYLGRLDLEFEKVDGVWTLKDFNGYLYDTAEVEADSYLQLIIDNYRSLFENVKKAA